MRKWLVLGGFVLVLALVLAGGLWWRQRPMNAAQDALAKLGTAKTQKFEANLTIGNATANEGLLGQPAQVQLLLNGQYERKEDTRDSLGAEVHLVTETEGLTVRIEGDTRFIDDKAYIRVATAPQTFPVLVQLKNQWLELPRGGANTDVATDSDEPILASAEREGTDRVDGQRVIVYSGQATSAAVVRLLDNIADILGTRLTAEQITGIKEGITGVDTVPLTLKVTPWSHQLRELSTTLNLPNSNSVTFTLKPSDRNEPVDIAVPDGAVTLEGAVAGLQTTNTPAPTQ